MTESATAEFSPVFDWSSPRGRKLTLISFISGSAALHALCFYMFQIIYPPTVALRPPPARVNIITPATDEGRLLLQWIEAEDPALSSTAQRPPEASYTLPQPEHIPSYISRKPALREPPPYHPDLHVPSSRAPAPVPMPRNAASSPAAIIATELKFSVAANWLHAAEIPPLHFTASNKEPPQSAEFRIAIGSRGEVRHCFLQRSSGDAALDQQVRKALLLCRFGAVEVQNPKIEANLLWATATVEWGNDIAVPALTAPDRSTP